MSRSTIGHMIPLRCLLIAATMPVAMALSACAAHALSADVKSACKADYFRHCSQHAVGSQELRQCMRKVGEDLSTPCLVALVNAGEVTRQDIESYKARQAATGKPGPSAASGAAPSAPVKPRAAAKDKVEPRAKPGKSQPVKAALKPGKPSWRADKAAAPTGRPANTTAVAKRPVREKAAKAPPAQRPASSPSPSRAPPPPAGAQPRVAGWKSADPAAGTAPAYTHIQCRATALNGELEIFTCGLDEKCCYGALFNEKLCVPAAKSCF